MLEENPKRYRKLITQVRPVLVRRYGQEPTEDILKKTDIIYREFLSETPSIGGKENVMSGSLDMVIHSRSFTESQ